MKPSQGERKKPQIHRSLSQQKASRSKLIINSKGLRPFLQHTAWSEQQKVKNLSPSQMFLWKPQWAWSQQQECQSTACQKNKDPSQPNADLYHRGKQLERNSLTFPPSLQKLNSRVVTYIWHKHEWNTTVRSWRREHTSDAGPNTNPLKYLRNNLNFCKFCPTEESRSLEMIRKKKHCLPDQNIKLWKLTLSSALQAASCPSLY